MRLHVVSNVPQGGFKRLVNPEGFFKKKDQKSFEKYQK